MKINLQQLKQSSLEELEDFFCQPEPVLTPKGCYDGCVLMRLDEPENRRPLYWGSKSFEIVPFGVDFDSCNWFFITPRLQVGHFRMETARSRWRDCKTVTLNYDVSSIPAFARKIFYDEVRPLSDDLCLGIGGFNDKAGVGDHFFFALQRRTRP